MIIYANKDFGAQADGRSDDSDALQSAINYCISVPQYKTPILVLEGVYRITKTLVIGGNSIKAKDAFISGTNIINQGLYDANEFGKGNRSAQLIIRGEGTTSIYADFESTELTPVICYQAAGDTRNAASTRQRTGTIENIGIYGKGCFNANGIPQLRTIPNYKANNQVAILGLYSINLRLRDVYIRGFKEGVILNNCNFYYIDNLMVEYCERAGYEIQNHTGRLQLVSAWYCDKGFEIRSNQMIFENYYAGGCGIGLHVASSNNLFSSIYLESSKTTEGQLIIGDNAGEPNASTRLLSGLLFNMLTIVASGTDGSMKDGVVWKENARRMSINGGSIQSCSFRYNPLMKVRYEGLLGNLPTSISIKLD